MQDSLRRWIGQLQQLRAGERDLSRIDLDAVVGAGPRAISLNRSCGKFTLVR